MAVLRRWVLVWTALLWGALQLVAASTEENQWRAAKQDLVSHSYERAETNFAGFIQTYTNSDHLAEARLYQAEARLRLGRPDSALQLLTNSVAQAGKWSSEYLFFTGDALAQKGDYRGAADTFARLLQAFPNSPRRLEAAVEQAEVCSRLGDWPRVVELLQQPGGAFQLTARTNAASDASQRGRLLLSRAWLRQTQSSQRFTSAEAALQPLARAVLKPAIGWEREWLLSRIQLGKGLTNEALLNTTNLLSLAVQAGDPARQAETYEFRAGLLESQGQLEEAISAYTNNLAEGVPAENQREALLQSTRLCLELNRTAEAVQTLERFVSQFSNAPAADLALLTLGGLHLRQSVAGLNAEDLEAVPPRTPEPTNAIARLQELVRRFPQSSYRGKAQLDLGWCFWLQSELPAALTNFQAAAGLLPASLDRATACFKLADTQFRLGDSADALTNYKRVVQECTAGSEVRTNLLEAALYQVVHAGLAAHQLGEATNALGRLLELFPDKVHTAPAVLVAGQAIAQEESPSRARDIFSAFAAQATNSTLLPQVRLAIARTWEEEDNWTNAVHQYALLSTNLSEGHVLKALAEFYLAQAAWRAGDPARALVLYTNFIAQNPSHTNAPMAQLWVGDYYFNQGNWSAAELTYEQLCENSNWQSSELVDPAWMMAGRAAYQQTLWSNATNDFTHLIYDPRCPTGLRLEAMFAFADCYRSQLSKEKTEANRGLLEQAIGIFNRILEQQTNGPQFLRALGAKAATLVQLAQATGEPGFYTNALSVYDQIVTNRTADVALRSQAEVGLALALKWEAEQKSGAEQTALLKQALNDCLDVAHGTILLDNEKADPDWTLMAADRAITLAEALQDWPEAISLCNEFADLFPTVRAQYLERARSLVAKHGNVAGND